MISSVVVGLTIFNTVVVAGTLVAIFTVGRHLR